MRVLLIALLPCLAVSLATAQPNCLVYQEDDRCYQACKEAIRAIHFRQGSKQSQDHFDRSIDLCPGFAYSYQQKAIPFLKRGQFMEWKKLIDKAVDLAPSRYLGYRGWCRLQFLRDYEGAIVDIEQFRRITYGDIGYCQTGDYHLEVALALCYKQTGHSHKARQLIRNKLAREGADAYDYYHLGVLEYEEGNYELAISYLNEQLSVNDYLAETYYFKALCYQKRGMREEFEAFLRKAEVYYKKGMFRRDTYAEPQDKIYLGDILACRWK